MTKKEFMAFLLVYAAYADLVVNQDEYEFISERIGLDNFVRLSHIYRNNTDSENLQLLVDFRQIHFPGEEGKKELLSTMKEVFLSDEEFHPMEKQMLKTLNVIL